MLPLLIYSPSTGSDQLLAKKFDAAMEAALAAAPSRLTEQIAGIEGFWGDEWHQDLGKIFQPLVRRTDPPDALMRLIRLGPPVVPELCRRLSSRRPTKLEIKDTWVQLRRDPSFDVRANDRVGSSRSIAGDNLERLKPPYILTEGDLAYFALGQIVNRSYLPFSGAGMVCITSPQMEPALLSAVRRLWGHAKPADVRRSLRYDVLHPDSYEREGWGLRRLATFFPKDAPDIGLTRLKMWRGDEPVGPLRSNWPFDLVAALGPIHSPSIDRECARILTLYRGSSELRKPRRYLLRSLVARLSTRPRYRDLALAYAKAIVREGGPEAKLYERFLSANKG